MNTDVGYKKMLLISPEFLDRLCKIQNTQQKQLEIEKALKHPPASKQAELAQITKLLSQYQVVSSRERLPLRVPVVEVDAHPNIKGSPVKSPQSLFSPFLTSTPRPVQQLPFPWDTLPTPKSTARRDRTKTGPTLSKYRPKSHLRPPKRLEYKK